LQLQNTTAQLNDDQFEDNDEVLSSKGSPEIPFSLNLTLNDPDYFSLVIKDTMKCWIQLKYNTDDLIDLKLFVKNHQGIGFIESLSNSSSKSGELSLLIAPDATDSYVIGVIPVNENISISYSLMVKDLSDIPATNNTTNNSTDNTENPFGEIASYPLLYVESLSIFSTLVIFHRIKKKRTQEISLSNTAQ